MIQLLERTQILLPRAFGPGFQAGATICRMAARQRSAKSCAT
jgi:hypothetical protein